MLLTINNRVIHSKGRFLSIERNKDIILTFTVRGTCFPAKYTLNATAALTIVSASGISNKVMIDFADGTGEHAYTVASNGTARQLQFRNLSGGTTPAAIQGTAWYDAPVYFYQDLPAGVKNTVNDDYDVQRPIKIRFEKPQSVTSMSLANFRVYDVFPSAISKLKQLSSLTLSNLMNLTSFAQDFLDSYLQAFIASASGTFLNLGIPEWILKSKRLRQLVLYGAANLSGTAESKKVDRLNEIAATLVNLDIGNTSINYPLPDSFADLINLNTLYLSYNTSTAVRMPANLGNMVALKTLNLYQTRMPLSEYIRIMTTLPALEDIDLGACNITTDLDLPAENTTIKTVTIGGNNQWNGRMVPSFVNKLPNLVKLDLSNTYVSVASNWLQTWGNFSNCINIDTIDLSEQSGITTDIPVWWSVLTKLKTLTCYASFQTQARMDTWVNNLYAFVVANAGMAAGNTKFRNMTVGTYGTVTAFAALTFRPSGTYQQPAGYVQGTNNGTPATPMEKIWVLTKQYNHVWTVKP